MSKVVLLFLVWNFNFITPFFPLIILLIVLESGHSDTLYLTIFWHFVFIFFKKRMNTCHYEIKRDEKAISIRFIFIISFEFCC